MKILEIICAALGGCTSIPHWCGRKPPINVMWPCRKCGREFLTGSDALTEYNLCASCQAAPTSTEDGK